jgi:hypothetical protein
MSILDQFNSPVEARNRLMELTLTACSCEECKAMCWRPCWGLPEEFHRLMDTGLGHRLSLGCWEEGQEKIYFLYPSQEDNGCTFWNEKHLCEIHESGMKPLDGYISDHHYLTPWVRRDIIMTWNTPEGKQIIERWKRKFGMGKS